VFLKFGTVAEKGVGLAVVIFIIPLDYPGHNQPDHYTKNKLQNDPR